MTVITLWLIRSTEKAFLFSRLPPEKYTEKEDEIWIGRILVENIIKMPEQDGMRLCDVKLPEWLIEKENL